jgi:hypothetical protein
VTERTEVPPQSAADRRASEIALYARRTENTVDKRKGIRAMHVIIPEIGGDVETTFREFVLSIAER